MTGQVKARHWAVSNRLPSRAERRVGVRLLRRTRLFPHGGVLEIA